MVSNVNLHPYIAALRATQAERSALLDHNSKLQRELQSLKSQLSSTTLNNNVVDDNSNDEAAPSEMFSTPEVQQVRTGADLIRF